MPLDRLGATGTAAKLSFPGEGFVPFAISTNSKRRGRLWESHTDVIVCSEVVLSPCFQLLKCYLGQQSVRNCGPYIVNFNLQVWCFWAFSLLTHSSHLQYIAPISKKIPVFDLKRFQEGSQMELLKILIDDILYPSPVSSPPGKRRR